MARFRREANPGTILALAQKFRSVGEDGSVTFSGGRFEDQVSILSSMLEAREEISDLERSSMVREAMFRAEGAQLTVEGFLAALKAAEIKFFRRKPTVYELISELSIRCSSPRKFTLGGRSVYMLPEVPVFYRDAREKIINLAGDVVYGALPKNYSCFRVSIEARSDFSAAAQATDIIDLFRAKWNFFHNRNQISRDSFGPVTPVNLIVPGPVHTLHRPGGTLATETWWHETTYRRPVRLFSDMRKFESMLKFGRSLTRAIGRLRYQNEFDRALVRYVRALDSSDMNYAFLQLWAVLEQLTGVGKNESHKDVVNRASFIYRDRDYVRELLMHLRESRNSSVHGGKDAHNGEVLVFQLKRVVETVFGYHLACANRYRTMAEAAKFLDSASDLNLIDGQISELRRAKKFVSGAGI